jgi:hypothetical protein
MTELEARAPVPLGLNEVLTEKRLRIAAICVALFIVTFAVYWRLSPQETAYPHQVNQANNIIHGHLDMDPQYTRNYNTLERVLYDGHGFCFSPGDPRASLVENPRFSPTCKTYMQHSLGPAFIVIPGVLVWGDDLNQTLVSVIFGAMTAPIVFLVAARFSKKLLNQLLLTALMMFGTVLWWVASNGGVWFFAHTTGTFFLFAAIYWAIARPNPLLAGAMLGAAFMCRPTLIATGLFFVIIFIPLWLKRPTEEDGRWGINLMPVMGFAAGLAPFLALEGIFNYLRYDNPLESGYGYTEQLYETNLTFVYPHGLFDLSYITRHPPVALEAMPVFTKPGTDCGNGLDCAPVMSSFGGMAIWATTPVFLTALFTGVNNKIISRVGALLVGLACAFILSRAVSRYWESSWETAKIPSGLELGLMIAVAIAFSIPYRNYIVTACCVAIIPTAYVIFHFVAVGWAQFGDSFGLDSTSFLNLLGHGLIWPFWLMITVAVGFSIRNRDRLVIACWAAIIPTAFAIFNFAATGWAQFGYRYGLDFSPFLWLLVARFIGDNLKWWHVVLITIAIAVNLGGVLFTYQFDPHHTNNWAWLTF